MRSLLFGVLLLVGACDWIDQLAGEYSGPLPVTVNLDEERVILRAFSRDPAGPEQGKLRQLYLDRVRYLDGRDFSDVNRVVLGETGELTDFVESLDLAIGDTVLVTTDYQGVYYGGAASGVVPSWPGDDYIDYPVAVHRLVKIRRAAP